MEEMIRRYMKTKRIAKMMISRFTLMEILGYLMHNNQLRRKTPLVRKQIKLGILLQLVMLLGILTHFLQLVMLLGILIQCL
jgi:hypothetical protein